MGIDNIYKKEVGSC